MKMDKKGKELIGLLMCFFIGVVLFIGCSSDKLPAKKINAYTEKNANTWENSKEVYSGAGTAFKLQILNNPYQFTHKEKLLIYINEELAYKGNFAEKANVKIPSRFLGKRVVPTLQIITGQGTHNFIHKVSTYIGQHDQFVYIVFCPKNDLTKSCYLFFQEEEIL